MATAIKPPKFDTSFDFGRNVARPRKPRTSGKGKGKAGTKGGGS
jgi:hypothetical protein